MTGRIHQATLHNLRSTRDLRAEILSLAADLAAKASGDGQLRVVAPLINEQTIRREWETLMPAITLAVRKRMTLAIDAAETFGKPTVQTVGGDNPPLEKPNYRYEVLRLLLGAHMEGASGLISNGIARNLGGTQRGLIETLGVSATPVRSALAALRDSGLIRNLRNLELSPDTLSMDLLRKLGASPQTIRFRFERGARIKAPAELLERAQSLLTADSPPSWRLLSLSGTPVAQFMAPDLDLLGTPRLDLVAHVPRADKYFGGSLLRMLDDGLEPEPNVLAPAPVVITLVRAASRFDHLHTSKKLRCAHRCDVFLSLLDLGLREQALQFARALRQ